MRTLEIENKTDEEKIKLEEYKQKEEKTNKRIKEKNDNKMSFAHYKLGKNGRPEEELNDDGLIKRAFKNWNKLRTPAYYKQTALFVIT